MKQFGLLAFILLLFAPAVFTQTPGGKPVPPVKTLFQTQEDKYLGIWDGEVNDGTNIIQVAIGFGRTPVGVFGGELGFKLNGKKGQFKSVLVLENGAIFMDLQMNPVTVAKFSGGFTTADKIGGKLVMEGGGITRNGTWTATRRSAGAAGPTAIATPSTSMDMDGYIAKLKTLSTPGNSKNVIPVATECIAKFPSSIPCHLSRSSAYFAIYKAKPLDFANMKVMGKQDQDPDWQRAIDDLTKVISIAPGNASFYTLRGEIYLEGWNSDTAELAVADLKKAIELQPGSTQAASLLKKAKTNLASSLSKEASDLSISAAFVREKDPKEADKRLNEAILMMNKVIEFSPDYSIYLNYSQRAGIYRDLKKYDLAIADYAKTTKLSPDYGEAYNQRAAIYRIQKKNSLALADYEALLARPDNFDANLGKPAAILGKAELQLEAGQLDSALAGFNAVLAKNPEFSAGYLGRGQVYLKKGDKAAAQVNFEKYLSLSFNRVASEKYLAELGIEPYRSKYPNEKTKKAVPGPKPQSKQIETPPKSTTGTAPPTPIAAKTDPVGPKPGVVNDSKDVNQQTDAALKSLMDEAWQLYFDKKDNRGALSKYDEVIQKYPNFALAYSMRSGIYIEIATSSKNPREKIDNRAKALDDVSRAISFGTNNPYFYLGRADINFEVLSEITTFDQELGVVENEDDKKEKAQLIATLVSDCNQFNELLGPNAYSPKIYYYMGKAHLWSGDTEKARKDFEESIRQNPDHPYASLSKTEIGKLPKPQ